MLGLAVVTMPMCSFATAKRSVTFDFASASETLLTNWRNGVHQSHQRALHRADESADVAAGDIARACESGRNR